MIWGRIDLLISLNSYNISGKKLFKQHSYKQRKADKKLSKSLATHWGWTFVMWKLFAFFIHVVIQEY